MMAIRLAFRNLVGAGLRTWLNVFILSLAFVIIIWHKGFLDGWDVQARRDLISYEYGGGQYWQNNYDPYDPFTLEDSHSPINGDLNKQINLGNLTPILISQGTIYPQGRIQSVLIKGIDPDQNIIDIPSKQLVQTGTEIPIIIGTRMAESSKLKLNDTFTVRWRDINGTFDATEAKIVGIFKNNVPTTDVGQIWIPINKLRKMKQMPDEATIIVLNKNFNELQPYENWEFKDQDFLLTEITELIKAKSAGGSIMWGILILLAMLAIFDTQILSIFKRQKEIGTYMALGMTRGQVVRLFTTEGAMHGILAIGMAAIYGIPLLLYSASTGFSMPEGTDDYGLAIAETIIPAYSVGLVISTVLTVMIITIIVSYIPTRKISKMKPTEAIRGKIQ
ncbi:ABC transporter permease [Bacteroidota bacterium]